MTRSKKNSVFGKSEALERVTSPDDLNQYIRVTSPSVWLVIGALYILLLVGLWWAMTGNILTTTSCQAIRDKQTAYGYLTIESAAGVAVGQDVLVTLGDSKIEGQIIDVSPVPVSPAQAAETLGSPELAASVVPQNGGVQVTASLATEGREMPPGKALVQMEIVLSDVTPIQLVMGK